MKNIVYLSLAFLLLNACSYKKNSYPHSLLQADSLAFVNPDSAVSLLKSIKEDMVSQPEEVRMYYQLLCVKAVWALNDVEAVPKMQFLYNYTLKENENNQLKTENTRELIYLTGSVLGIVFITLCFFIYYMYSKKQQLKLEMQLMKLKHIEEEQYQKSHRFVKENKKE